MGTAKPFFISGEDGLGFEASWNEYWMGKNNYVKDVLLHHKSFHFVFHKGGWKIKAGLQHFVQWSGTSPKLGKQPSKLDDYWRIVLGKQGAAGAHLGDQQNALGNHLGGYELSVSKKFKNFDALVFYNHLFEDGSGMMLRNTPDGRYALYLETKEKKELINSFIYELYYTQHQSYTFPNTDGRDDYFNNFIYRDGWTYEKMVLGAPFFTVGPDGEGIINNKFTAHHLGIGGEIGNSIKYYPYKLLLSFARNDGLYKKRNRPKQNVFYFFTDVQLLQNELELHLQFGADYNSYTNPVYGAGFKIKYRLQ